MSSRLRVFATSVGTKLLIGVTGLVPLPLLDHPHRRQPHVVFGPGVFNAYADMLDGNPLIPVIEIGLLLVLPGPHLQDGRMFLANQEARPVGYAQKQARRTAEPQDARVLDDDRHRPLAARLPRHPRADVPVRRRTTRRRPAIVDLYRARDGAFANPLRVALLRRSAWWSSARTSGTASSSALPVARLRSPAVDAAARCRPARCSRS